MNPVEIHETIQSIPHQKILKFLNLFVDYVDNSNLYELKQMIEKKETPSLNFLEKVVENAKNDQKLFQWIEVLLKF